MGGAVVFKKSFRGLEFNRGGRQLVASLTFNPLGPPVEVTIDITKGVDAPGNQGELPAKAATDNDTRSEPQELHQPLGLMVDIAPDVGPGPSSNAGP